MLGVVLMLTVLSGRALPAAVQSESGDDYGLGCGTNQNLLNDANGHFHGSASQPAEPGYYPTGDPVPAANYHTATGTWYYFSQVVSAHQV